MKINVEQLSEVKKKVHVEIPVEEVAKEVDSAYEDLRKKAKIKGFRPGKVPRGILERYFKDYIKTEVLQKLIQDTYPKAFSEASLTPVSSPVIDPQELEMGKPFQYTATVETKPDIKTENYLGLKIEGKKEEVREEEVEERLRALQNLHANLKTIIDSRPIQTGDYAIIDYEASMDGKTLEEAKAVDFTIEVGSNRFIPALEEKLVGLRPEEEKEIEITFPEDFSYKKWAGKTVSFRVKIKEIKEKILPLLDDEFARDLGDFSSLENLKSKLREDIEKEKKLALDRQMKDQLVEQLLQANPFEIPESMVEAQTHSLISDLKARLATQGMDMKNLDIPEEKLHEDYKERAQKQVRTFLILEKISDQEGITVTDQEVEGRLGEISQRTNQKLDLVKRYYEKNELIPEVKAGILTDKTLNFLLEKADITYR